MGKKSAKSKGYRKTKESKPYLSKKEWIALAVLVAVVLVVVLLFSLLNTDGALKLSDGKPVVKGENSLIAAATDDGRTKYYKVGQLTSIEGYTMEARPSDYDANITTYVYTPDESSEIDEVRVSAYASDAALMALSMQATQSSVETTSCGELQFLENGDHDVSYYVYTQPASEEGADYAYQQGLNAYISAGDRCVVVHIVNHADAETDYVDEQTLRDILIPFRAALSYETK